MTCIATNHMQFIAWGQISDSVIARILYSDLVISLLITDEQTVAADGDIFLVYVSSYFHHHYC